MGRSFGSSRGYHPRLTCIPSEAPAGRGVYVIPSKAPAGRVVEGVLPTWRSPLPLDGAPCGRFARGDMDQYSGTDGSIVRLQSRIPPETDLQSACEARHLCHPERSARGARRLCHPEQSARGARRRGSAAILGDRRCPSTARPAGALLGMTWISIRGRMGRSFGSSRGCHPRLTCKAPAGRGVYVIPSKAPAGRVVEGVLPYLAIAAAPRRRTLRALCSG